MILLKQTTEPDLTRYFNGGLSEGGLRSARAKLNIHLIYECPGIRLQ